MQRHLSWTLPTLLAVIATPAAASLETVIAGVSATDPAHVVVQLRLLNAGATPLQVAAPAEFSASLTSGGKTVAVTLRRAGAGVPATVAARAFVADRFEATVSEQLAGGVAVLSLDNGSSFAFQMPGNRRDIASAVTAPAVEETPSSPRADTGNAFLHNLSAYDPIYAVYGPGTDSAAKIQISFKYQLFGRENGIAEDRSLLDRLHFAYTQRIYWDLGKESSPFRNVDYMPELVYIVPARSAGPRAVFGGQLGVRHESNGRDGVASRSLNTIYIQPVATVPIGKYRLSVGPRLWAFLGDLSDNHDVKRYRGNTGLFAEIGTDDGLRLTTNSRYNFGTGKGSIDASASYPLDRLIPSLNLYVFGQAFTGYGENLLDYNRYQTRLRFGVGIVR